MLNKRRLTILLFINIIIISTITVEYLYFMINRDFILKFIEAQLIGIFFYSVLSTYSLVKNWLDIYIMFLALIFLFLLTRPFMHLFDLVEMINYNEHDWFRIRDNFMFSNFTMNKVNFILIYMLLFLNIGYLIGLKKYFRPFSLKNLKLQYTKYLNPQMGYIFFIIGLFAFLIKVFLYIKLLNNFGYFYLYSGNYTLPIFVRVFDDFFYIGYVIIMINIPNKEKAYIISLIFILLYSTMLFTGMRGEFFTLVFTVIYLLSFLYQWRVKLWQIISVGMSLMILAQFTIVIKFSNVSFENIDLFDMINLFLYSQGVSILILGYFIEFSDYFVNIYSGFRYLISTFISTGYTLFGQYGNRYEMSPETIYSVSDKLQYFTSPDGYYNGAGTGSSFIAEIYGLGGDIFFVAIGSFLLTYLIAYISRKMIYQKYGFFIFLIILPILFWIARAGYIYPIKKYFFALILLFGFIFIYNLVFSKIRKVEGRK